jgi:WG containing repeat
MIEGRDKRTPLNYCIPPKHRRGAKRLRRGMGAFWQAMAVLLLFQALSPTPVALPSPQQETEHALLSPAQQGEKWGYIDAAGKFLIPPQFDAAEPFSEGLAAVEVRNRFGYIGSDGHFVIQPKFFAARLFKEGLALVATRKPSAPFGSEYGEFRLAQITYVDRSGREIRAPQSVRRAASFSGGLAAVVPDSALRLKGLSRFRVPQGFFLTRCAPPLARPGPRP